MKFFGYEEKITHGTEDFPIALYAQTSDGSQPRYIMPPHWHREYEIIRVHTGELQLRIDDEEFIAKKGDIVFIHAGQIHQAMPTDCDHECLVFNIKMLLKSNCRASKKIEDLLTEDLLIPTLLPSDIAPLKKAVDALFESTATTSDDQALKVHLHLYDFFSQIINHQVYQPKSESGSSKQKIERLNKFRSVLTHIEDNYHANISLEDLAKIAGMNQKYFCKFFNQLVQSTPIEYLNAYRIEMAKTKLLNTDDSIIEISYNCGFNDSSYFSKVFKKYTGLSPRKFRQENTPFNA